jgi:hypothetical protein
MLEVFSEDMYHDAEFIFPHVCTLRREDSMVGDHGGDYNGSTLAGLAGGKLWTISPEK